MEGLNMDDQKFDNIARRLGQLRSRRDALKIASCGTVAVFAALGLENSALAQVTIENHCKAIGTSCTKKKQCCGARRSSKEIVCSSIAGRTGKFCCGQATASCEFDTQCCSLFRCNNEGECVRI
jgi:hypothetical protein